MRLEGDGLGEIERQQRFSSNADDVAVSILSIDIPTLLHGCRTSTFLAYIYNFYSHLRLFLFPFSCDIRLVKPPFTKTKSSSSR